MQQFLFRIVLILFLSGFSTPELSAQTGKLQLRGRVADTAQKEPLPGATVKLFRSGDSVLLSGTFSDASGMFSFDGLTAGSYRLVVHSLGYTECDLPYVPLDETRSGMVIAVNMRRKVEDAGKVVVTARRDLMEIKPDKKVFNVSQMPVASGGTANDILKNIPSVEISIDGNVSLRGSQNVTVLIDGKASTLTGANRQAILDQLPAGSIETVEVITNPGAQFDPEGMAGIINIVLKKDRKRGINGNASAGIGTRNKYTGGIALNYGTQNWNVYGNYNYRFERRFNYGDIDRTQNTDSFTRLKTASDGLTHSGTHLLRAGGDWSPGKKDNLSASVTMNLKKGDKTDDIQYRYLNGADILYSYSPRNSDENNSGNTVDLNTNWRHTYGTRHTLSVDLNHSIGSTRREADYRQSWENSGPATFLKQFNRETNDNQVTMLSADYVKPLKETGWKGRRMDMGGRITRRNILNDFYSETYDSLTDKFRNDTLISNRFSYKELVLAAYGVYSASKGRWNGSAGLRVEQTFTRPYLETTGEKFNREYLSLFPNLGVSYSLKEKRSLRFSYSRRLNRPQIANLNPFTDYSDPTTLRRGNPNLQPEFIHSIETGYEHGMKSSTLLFTGYLRIINGSYGRYVQVDSTLRSTITFVNLKRGYNYGLEAIWNYRPLKWLSGNLSGNFYASVLDASNISSDIRNNGFNYSLNMNTSIIISPKYSLQISGRYRNPMPIAQGFIDPMYGVDVALRATWWKGAGSLVLNFSDVFNQTYFGVSTSGSNFTQDAYRKRESQVGFLTFTWKFGQKDIRSSQPKETPREMNREVMDAF